MKKIYLLLLGFTFTLGLSVNAQVSTPVQGTAIKPIDPLPKSQMYQRTDGSFYIDMAAYDATLHTVNYYGGITSGGNSYQHNNYDTLTGSFAMAYQKFDSLITTPDYAAWNYDPNSSLASMTIDSVFVWCQHDNTSGMNDTIRVSLVGLDASRRPVDATVLWTYDEVSNTADGQQVLSYSPGIVRTGSNWGFAVKVEYRDPSVLDTFNLIFGELDLCDPSEVYPVCYYRVNIGPANSILIPLTNDQGYWYDDCNSSSSPDWPEENTFDHWGIWVYITMLDNAGIAEQTEKGIKVLAYPNPANDFLNVNFTLLNDADNVNLTITDLGGRAVMSKTLGAFAAGKNVSNVQIDLPSGVYTYSLDVDGTRITRKFIVSK